MDALLRFVLDPAVVPPAVDELRAWWDASAVQRAGWTAPFDRALAGGACADRLGFAFANGYAEALRALVPDLAAGSISALCASEEGGAHPRAIRTRLVETAPGRYELTGRKKWGTIASAASTLLVVASVGEAAGQNRLRVIRVRADAPGVRLSPTTTAFVPEIPHAEVELAGVAVTAAEVLPGDGYDAYLKPFRTIEDIYVNGAIAGYLIGVARRYAMPRELRERLIATAVIAHSIASADPRAVTTHAALAGMLDLLQRSVAEIEPLWAAANDAEWARWQRDRSLFRVAGAARAARRERAWAILDGGASSGSANG